MRGRYQYAGLEAELYDRLDELSDFDDLEFYLWFAGAASGEVLDLGCGTGRVLVPLVERGFAVTGMDGSPRMLELCAANLRQSGLEAELVQGDMRAFDFGERRFGTVLIPGFSIQMLLGEGEVASCLECCRKHLKEGGQLVIPTYMPWDIIWDGRSVASLEERRSVSAEGGAGRFVALQGWEIDAEAQRLVLRNRFEKWGSDGEFLAGEEKEMTMRWYLPHEFMMLLGEAGFSDVSVYGDFGLEPPEPESESVVYVARV